MRTIDELKEATAKAKERIANERKQAGRYLVDKIEHEIDAALDTAANEGKEYMEFPIPSMTDEIVQDTLAELRKLYTWVRIRANGRTLIFSWDHLSPTTISYPTKS